MGTEAYELPERSEAYELEIKAMLIIRKLRTCQSFIDEARNDMALVNVFSGPKVKAMLGERLRNLLDMQLKLYKELEGLG